MLAIAIAVFCGKTGQEDQSEEALAASKHEVAVTRGLTRDPSFAVSDTDKNVLRNTNSFRMHERARNFLEMRIYRRLS